MRMLRESEERPIPNAGLYADNTSNGRGDVTIMAFLAMCYDKFELLSASEHDDKLQARGLRWHLHCDV
jgi:hypothetical protein